MPRTPLPRRTFLVGRLDRSTSELQLVEPRTPPFPGPWSLKAVVRGRGPELHIVR